MKHVHFSDVEGSPVEEGAEGVAFRMLIGPEDGAANFYMRNFEIAPGGHTPLHEHAWEHEVFVHSGSGRVNTASGPEPISAGDVVFVPGGQTHQFENTGSEPLQIICLVPAESG